MKTCTHSHRAPRLTARRSHQSGVILLFALIALTVMLVGAVALIGSFNTSLVAAGNMSFKRDMQNQGERATAQVYDQFVATTGFFKSPAIRAFTKQAENYSAIVLPTNSQGIPQALMLKDTAFSSAGWVKPDIQVTGQNVKIRYLIDRLCRGATPTTPTTEGVVAQVAAADACIRAPAVPPTKGGDEANMRRSEDADTVRGIAGGVPVPVVYRLSVRVMGPRNTEAFFQTTFTEPL
jgi:type IV pilus assembly protein PilX